MDTKHIHCMLEKMAEYGKCMIEEGAGSGNVNLEDAKKIVEMVGELAEAEYHALIAKEMRKANEEDEAEEKHFLKMLKDEYKDEFKKMKEEYGEDEGERRFYDNYRYANGRFAPKGRGSYKPRSRRRGYEESMIPLDYQMTPEDYKIYPPEYWRDMDRLTKGVMYYTQTGSDANINGRATGNSDGTSSSNTSENSASARGYTDGYNEGNRRGYSEGYEQGNRDGRSQVGNSRYDKARRGYEESKEKHKGNTPQDNSENMKSLEELLNSTGDVIVKDYAPKMSQSERAMAAQKFDTWSKMLKQQ